jgi:hypothetical protein
MYAGSYSEWSAVAHAAVAGVSEGSFWANIVTGALRGTRGAIRLGGNNTQTLSLPQLCLP